MNLLTIITVFTLLITGMGVALLGTIKLPLSAKLGIGESQVGGLISLFGLTTIPVILIAGFLTDGLGMKQVLIWGGLFVLAGLVLLALANAYHFVLTGVLLFAIGWALLVNVVNPLTPYAFIKEISQHSAKMSFATNLGNSFFGLGAFLTPLAIGFFIKRHPLKRIILCLATIVMVFIILTLWTDFSVVTVPTSAGEVPSLMTILSKPILWICGVALFFYGPIEASLAAWTTTLLEAKGMVEKKAFSLLSAFWLSYMLSRLSSALWVGDKLSTVANDLEVSGAGLTLLLFSFATMLSVTVLVKSRNHKLATLFVIITGLMIGPLFPTLIATLLTGFAKSAQGRATGLYYAIGNLGWTLVPMCIGKYATKHGVQKSFNIVIASTAALVGIAILLLVYRQT